MLVKTKPPCSFGFVVLMRNVGGMSSMSSYPGPSGDCPAPSVPSARPCICMSARRMRKDQHGVNSTRGMPDRQLVILDTSLAPCSMHHKTYA